MLLSKKKLFSGISVGSWLQLPNVFSAEIMARAGFDWLAIDLEHGLIDLEKAYELIQVVELAGIVPLVRLNANDPSVIRRVMDAGSHGVIVPMVNSREDVIEAINAIKYPPEGKRSFGLGRAHGFGEGFKSYINKANSQSILIIQIEHIEAVNNLEEILRIKGIDGIIIGPYDLSGSMGVPGRFNDEQFKNKIESIVLKVKKSNIALGIHIVEPSKEEYKKRIKHGFSFIAYGMDTIFLSNGARNCLKQIKKKK